METTKAEERRTAPRTRALKAARIVFNHEYSSITCTVRNVSERGVKLLVESGMQVPDTFELVYSDGKRRHCVTRWRKLKEVGAEFTA